MTFVRLTPQEVRKLTPGQTISENGIKVVGLNKDARWYAEFTHCGVRVHRSLGLSSDGWTRTKVEDWVRAHKQELDTGRSSLPKGRKTHLRFGELADWYVTLMKQTGGKNLTQKELQIERRLKPAIGKIVCQQLTANDVGRYAKQQIDAGLSPATVNRDLATLSHILRTAVKAKKLSEVPCQVQRRKEPEGRIRILTDDEVDRLRSAAAADVNPDLWLFVEMGLNSAMRHSEMLRARFEDIDWKNRRLFLEEAKAGARWQPLTKELVETLRAEADARGDWKGWIFPIRKNQSKTGRAASFSGQFRRAVVQAGLDPKEVTPHVMRHTAITQLVAAGKALPAIQKVSGHKTLAMVLRYTHISDAVVDDTMDALSASLRRNRA